MVSRTSAFSKCLPRLEIVLCGVIPGIRDSPSLLCFLEEDRAEGLAEMAGFRQAFVRVKGTYIL